MEKGEESLWSIFSNINEWVKFSDTKAAIILGIYGAVSAFALPGLIDNIEFVVKNEILGIILALGIGFSIVSVIMSLLSLAPILKINKSDSKEVSLIYFTSISDNFDNPDKYFEAVKTKIDESDIERQISQQIWVNSLIAKKKFVAVKWSIRCMIGSTISGVLFIILALFIAMV